MQVFPSHEHINNQVWLFVLATMILASCTVIGFLAVSNQSRELDEIRQMRFLEGQQVVPVSASGPRPMRSMPAYAY